MPPLYGITAAALGGYLWTKAEVAQAWWYRDDIGGWWGIKGYEEQVSEVGTHKGHHHWTAFDFWGNYDGGSVRRGFQVFAKNCGNCHGMIHRKYDVLLDKAYEAIELGNMVKMFSISPAHHHFKQYFYQEWTDRDRVIHDRIYPTYISQEHAKNANGGAWPADFSKIRLRPGGINYIYNILTGYGYTAPGGVDVPEGKYFNPYFDHFVIGMPRQLQDDMIDYDDDTKASSPQMAFDVSNFISYMQRRTGVLRGDFKFIQCVVILGLALLYPIRYMKTKANYRNIFSYRKEIYAVRDGVYYKHFRYGMKNGKANLWRGKIWA